MDRYAFRDPFKRLEPREMMISDRGTAYNSSVAVDTAPYLDEK